jgi:hypothetical protein
MLAIVANISEEKDNYYVPEGWYEQLENWNEYGSLPVIEGDITHWIPLPDSPESGELNRGIGRAQQY